MRKKLIIACVILVCSIAAILVSKEGQNVSNNNLVFESYLKSVDHSVFKEKRPLLESILNFENILIDEDNDFEYFTVVAKNDNMVVGSLTLYKSKVSNDGAKFFNASLLKSWSGASNELDFSPSKFKNDKGVYFDAIGNQVPVPAMHSAESFLSMQDVNLTECIGDFYESFNYVARQAGYEDFNDMAGPWWSPMAGRYKLALAISAINYCSNTEGSGF